MEKIKNILFRVSYLPDYQACGKHAVAGILRKELTEMGYIFPARQKAVSGIVGTAVHAGIRKLLEDRLIYGNILKDSYDFAIAEFKKETAETVEFDTTTPDSNFAEKQISSILKSYTYMVLDKVDIEVDLEKRLEATITPAILNGISYQFTLSGQPDIVELKSKRLRDIKTGRSAQTYHAQLGGYTLLLKAMGETNPETCVIDHIARKKDGCGEPLSYTYTADLCENEARAVFSTAAQQISRFLSTGDISHIPHNQSNNLCGPKYCSAFGTDFCPVSKTIK